MLFSLFIDRAYEKVSLAEVMSILGSSIKSPFESPQTYAGNVHG